MALPHFATLCDIIRYHSADRPDRTAFVFEGEQMSYGELEILSNQIANRMLESGLRPADHVAYLGKNSATYFAILLACAKTNAILTPLNWRLAPPELAYILDDSQAKIIFLGGEFIEVGANLTPKLNHCQFMIAIESQTTRFAQLHNWLGDVSDQHPPLKAHPQNVILQLYTSGTTGRPKGVMLTHHNLCGDPPSSPAPAPDPKPTDADTAPPWGAWTSEDVSFIGMPCFHIGGTGWGIGTIKAGAKGVIAREFRANEVLDYIEKFKISKIYLVPSAMQVIVNDPRAQTADFSSIEYMLYGASPIPLDLLKRCMEVFKCGFVQLYGMTETSGTVTVLPPEDHDPSGNERMRSAGKALDGVEIAILDDDGNQLDVGETGQIAIKAKKNMKGYWNLPEATRETYSHSGWLRTGDAGRLDADGYLYIHDRVKDMIVSGGENVYPAEVENAVFSHPDVADVGVIGVPSDKWGEAVTAMVVLEPRSTASSDDIIAFARTQIAAYKCPKSVHFVDELPRNSSGKILRRVLREPFWRTHERAVN